MPKESVLKRICKYSFPYALAYEPEEMNQIEAILRSKEVKPLLPKEITWMWGKKAQTLNDGTKAVNLYAIKKSKEKKPLLEGDIITHAAQVFAEDRKPAVNIKMNQKGAHIWNASRPIS